MTFKTSIIAIAATSTLASTAMAQDAKPAAADPMAAMYGNTITLEIAPYWAAEQYYERDHTWTQIDGYGVKTAGTWSIKGGRGCQVQTKPPGPTYCQDFVARKVGDVWTNIDASTGNTIRIGLIAGRE